MRTFKILMLVTVLAAAVTSCSKGRYRKTPGGMPYLLFRGEGKDSIKGGNVVKYDATFKINDSVYNSSFGHVPVYAYVENDSKPYDLSEILKQLHPGDSLVTTQMMDTFIKRANGEVGPGFKKGDRIITYIKILGVFTSDSVARLDYDKTVKAYTEKEVAMVAKYLADKKINAVKTPSGAFVEVIKQGNGQPIDSGKYVSLNYVGTTFKGFKFDSNLDSAFNHLGPLSFVVGVTPMAKGFDEGVRQLTLGGSGRIYVPSMLGYGPAPDPRSGLKPYDNLIFDVTILDVKDKAPETNTRKLAPAAPANGTGKGNGNGQ